MENKKMIKPGDFGKLELEISSIHSGNKIVGPLAEVDYIVVGKVNEDNDLYIVKIPAFNNDFFYLKEEDMLGGIGKDTANKSISYINIIKNFVKSKIEIDNKTSLRMVGKSIDIDELFEDYISFIEGKSEQKYKESSLKRQTLNMFTKTEDLVYLFKPETEENNTYNMELLHILTIRNVLKNQLPKSYETIKDLFYKLIRTRPIFNDYTDLLGIFSTRSQKVLERTEELAPKTPQYAGPGKHEQLAEIVQEFGEKIDMESVMEATAFL